VFSLDKPEWLYITTGIFRVMMFCEPDKRYEIELPPKTVKTEADIRNPFFTPVVAHIQVIHEYGMSNTEPVPEGRDLNNKIFRFDTLLNTKNSEMMERFRRQQWYNSDSMIMTIESAYENDSSSYFKDYRYFRYGIIKINSRDVGLEYIFSNYLKTSTPKTDNPAYMELFGEMYKEFLFYFSRTPGGGSIRYLVDKMQDPAALIDTMMKHDAIPSPEFAELILLKEIYDLYSTSYFNKHALIIILDKISADPVRMEDARLAEEIKHYLIRLETGSTPPPFLLPDKNGSLKSLNDFKGKYVYLNFCTPDNYSCLKEFPFLKVLNRAHSNHLAIVTVMVTEFRQDMVSFMDRNQYDWTALFYNNDDKLLLDYDVKAYPTCYLLDREGKVIQSPATLATEGFEQELFRIMRSRGDL